MTTFYFSKRKLWGSYRYPYKAHTWRCDNLEVDDLLLCKCTSLNANFNFLLQVVTTVGNALNMTCPNAVHIVCSEFQLSSPHCTALPYANEIEIAQLCNYGSLHAGDFLNNLSSIWRFLLNIYGDCDATCMVDWKKSTNLLSLLQSILFSLATIITFFSHSYISHWSLLL